MLRLGDEVEFMVDGHRTEVVWASNDGKRVMLRGFRAQFPASDFRPARAPDAIPAKAGEIK